MTFTQSQDETPARAIGLALHELKRAKPNDRSAKDRAYAVTITEMEKVHAYFVMFAADQEGTTFLTVTVLFGSFRAKAWSYKPWWMVGADRGWIVGELKAGAPVALIDRYGGITVGQATRIKI